VRDDLRILLVTGDKGGCAFYRMELPAAIAKSENLPIRLAIGLPGKTPREVDYDRIREDFDVVVIQRPMKRVIFEAIPKMQDEGVTVIVEIDDDFTSLHHRNQAYENTSPDKHLEANRDLIRQSCLIADHVTVSTPALAEVYGGHGRVSIIPNFVPGFLLDWRVPKYARACGWSGTLRTHPTDLQVVGNGIARAMDITAGTFAVVGESRGVQAALRLKQRVPQTGWLPISDYWKALGRLSMGIAPLEDSPFNRAKSNLKGIEYAAMGVPFVASPLPEYRLLAIRGAGLLARTPDEWYHQTVNILTDNALRRELTEQGKQTIRDHYALEANWHLWPEAWERAWKQRNAKVSA